MKDKDSYRECIVSRWWWTRLYVYLYTFTPACSLVELFVALVDRRARASASQPATRKRVHIGTRLISTKIIKWRPSPPGSAVLNFAPILLSPPTQPAFSAVPFSSPPRPSSSSFFLCFFPLAPSPTPPTSSFAFRKRHNSRDDAKGSRRTEANEFFYATIPTNRNRGHRCVVTVEIDSRIRRRMIVAHNAAAYLNGGLALCRSLYRFARVSAPSLMNFSVARCRIPTFLVYLTARHSKIRLRTSFHQRTRKKRTLCRSNHASRVLRRSQEIPSILGSVSLERFLPIRSVFLSRLKPNHATRIIRSRANCLGLFGECDRSIRRDTFRIRRPKRSSRSAKFTHGQAKIDPVQVSRSFAVVLAAHHRGVNGASSAPKRAARSWKSVASLPRKTFRGTMIAILEAVDLLANRRHSVRSVGASHTQ